VNAKPTEVKLEGVTSQFSLSTWQTLYKMKESDFITKAKEFATELLGADQLKEYFFSQYQARQKKCEDAELLECLSTKSRPN